MSSHHLTLPQQAVLSRLERGLVLCGAIRWRTGGKRHWHLKDARGMTLVTPQEATVLSLVRRGFLTRKAGQRGTAWKTLELTEAGRAALARSRQSPGDQA